MAHTQSAWHTPTPQHSCIKHITSLKSYISFTGWPLSNDPNDISFFIYPCCSHHACYWYCPRSMHSRVYETLRCSSVCPSIHPSVCLSRCSSRGAAWESSRQQPDCGSTGPEHGTQYQIRAVPHLQPGDMVELLVCYKFQCTFYRKCYDDIVSSNILTTGNTRPATVY